MSVRIKLTGRQEKGIKITRVLAPIPIFFVGGGGGGVIALSFETSRINSGNHPVCSTFCPYLVKCCVGR